VGLPYRIFDILALPYDVLTAVPPWQAHCERLVAHFPEAGEGGRLVLDLGCGPGVSTFAYKRAAPGDRLVGLDAAAEMVRRARRADGDGACSWVLGDATRLPLRAEVADAVAGHSFLYLVQDRRAVLAEVARVLRPGGRLALLEPRRQGALGDTRSLVRILRHEGPRLAFVLTGWRLFASVSGAFSASGMERLLADAGLVDVRLETTLHGLGWIVEATKR